MASALHAHVAAFPAGGVPIKPGMNADQLASILAAYAHVVSVLADANAAPLSLVE